MTDWIKKKKENWPEGSLERTLVRDYPGCKSATEALKTHQKIVPEESNSRKYHPDYYAMRAILKEMEIFIELNRLDYDSLPLETRFRLKSMNVKSLDEAKFWKDAVLFEFKKHMERTNG